MRLDLFLVENHFFESRSKAQAAILDGEVWLDGEPVSKQSLQVNEEDNLYIVPSTKYVSRAAFKLKSFLSTVDIEIKNKNCMDIGSSTGGFTEVLLEEGAAKVFAIDVGTNQLHHSLRQNSKVKLFEQTNIVDFILPEKIEILTCDLAFVSTTSMLEVLNGFDFSYAIILFKPQFEVGKNVKRDKRGVVKDLAEIERAKRAFESFAIYLGWKIVANKESTLRGKDGNVEFFYAFKSA